VIERLRPFVLGADFQLLAGKSPPYFCLAQVQEYLHAPERYVALSYLRASWQVEDRKAVSQRLLEKAREHFAAALAALDVTDRQFPELALLCGEVERRLEKWDEAASRFRELEATGRLEGTPQEPIVAFQLGLIEKRDSNPQALDASALQPKRGPADASPAIERPRSLWEASGSGKRTGPAMGLGSSPRLPDVPKPQGDFPQPAEPGSQQ
jgi:hypothetical protein